MDGEEYIKDNNSIDEETYEDKEPLSIAIDTEIDEDTSSVNINQIEIAERMQASFQKTIDRLNLPAYSSAIQNTLSSITASAANPMNDRLSQAFEQATLAQKSIQSAFEDINYSSRAANASESLVAHCHFENDYLINAVKQPYELDISAMESTYMSERISEVMRSPLSDFASKIATLPEYYDIDFNYMLNPFQEVMHSYNESYSAAFKSIDFGNLLLDKMRIVLDDPLDRIINNDAFFDRERFSKVYLETLVECEWFPYINDSITLQYISAILDIRKHTRSIKSRTKQLNSFIFSVFNKKVLKIIKSDWYHIVADSTKSRIIRQCIDAHINGQYALSVCTLAPMWESIIKEKQNHKGHASPKVIKNYLFALVDEDEFPNSQIIKDYYEQFTMLHFEDEKDLKDDTPSRHPIAHGCFSKYPSKKMSLNAILFTDFLLNL